MKAKNYSKALEAAVCTLVRQTLLIDGEPSNWASMRTGALYRVGCTEYLISTGIDKYF